MGPARSRVLTIPNLISVARLLCVPVFLWMLWEPHPARRGAAILLAVLGATDWVDGWIARHFDQGSELGKILDPTADRVLLVAAAVALLGEGLPVGVNVILWVVLVREVLVAVATVGLGLAGARRIDVVWAGKAGTLALMFALPMFLIADAARLGADVLQLHGLGFRDRRDHARVLRGGEVRACGAQRAAGRTDRHRVPTEVGS